MRWRGPRSDGWRAMLLAVCMGTALLPADASAGGSGITGAWASTSGAERLIFLPGGYFRSCFAGGKTGNAAMGQWKRLAAGRYEVEFTHTARPSCSAPPQAIHRHTASIRGLVLVQRGELSLYVSGEFPPDVYRPAAPAALR